jgi:hypothetical protein
MFFSSFLLAVADSVPHETLATFHLTEFRHDRFFDFHKKLRQCEETYDNSENPLLIISIRYTNVIWTC